MWSLLSSYAQPEYARRIGVLLPPWRNLWSSDGIAAENGDMIVDRFTDGTTANPFFVLPKDLAREYEVFSIEVPY
jgi:hypothetical protein